MATNNQPLDFRAAAAALGASFSEDKVTFNPPIPSRFEDYALEEVESLGNPAQSWWTFRRPGADPIQKLALYTAWTIDELAGDAESPVSQPSLRLSINKFFLATRNGYVEYTPGYVRVNGESVPAGVEIQNDVLTPNWESVRFKLNACQGREFGLARMEKDGSLSQKPAGYELLNSAESALRVFRSFTAAADENAFPWTAHPGLRESLLAARQVLAPQKLPGAPSVAGQQPRQSLPRSF